MSSIDSHTKFLHLQDILGQILMLRTYTQISLFFVQEDDASVISETLDELKQGLVRLANGFPWLAGQVVIRGKAENATGSAQIVPCEPEISFIVNDLRDDPDVPSMSALTEANFPSKMLAREKIADMPAVGESFESHDHKPVRVLILQVSIIKGGIILTFGGVHHTMDMNGLGQVIYLFSKACRKESFTTKEIDMGNSDRRGVIPLLSEDFILGSDVEHFILKAKGMEVAAEETLPQSSSLSSPLVWAYFTFNAHNLRSLKTRAMTQKVVDYISTNDALTALMFQRIAKVRTNRFSELKPNLMFRSVDSRKLFGLEKEYLGHMVTGAYHFDADVADAPIDVLAGTLRKQMLDRPQLTHSTRAIVTLFDRAKDKNTVGYGPNFDLTRDILVSSWAGVPCYDCDFGILGKPDCVRRAKLAAMEGLVYFMPKTRDGEIATAMCLREDDIEALRRDEEFMSYAAYVG